MAEQTYSNFDRFLASFGELDTQSNRTRLQALKHYFASGGVIRVTPVSKGNWPVLRYPTRDRLANTMGEKTALKKKFESKKSVWQKKLLEAKSYHIVHGVKKLGSPLYWKHKVKYSTDKDYKEKSDKVKLPANLVSDKRWEPMVKMFLEDEEYRNQLTETVETSIVYKNDRKVAKFADSLQQFRSEESEKNLAELKRRIDALNEDIRALKELSKWV